MTMNGPQHLLGQKPTGKERGDAREAFNALASSLALIALNSGHATFAGMRWER